MSYIANANPQEIIIAGSSKFGKFPFINAERTYNMFVSDDYLISFAGYQRAINLNITNGEGRGLFYSSRGRFMLAVVNNEIYRIQPNLGWTKLAFNLDSTTGEVFMDENLSTQIVIVDGLKTYVYNYTTSDIGVAEYYDVSSASVITPDFTPNYVSYHNTYFLFGNANTKSTGSEWFIFETGFNISTLADPLRLNIVTNLTIQTKPDYARAVVRIPSAGNNILVMGERVCELWNNVGGLQVYQRNSSINIDYGVANVSTIAYTDKMVCWLGVNEKSSPAIMVMSGGQAERLSTDGIDNLLKLVKHPTNSTAFMFRQDGHVFYVLSFTHADDNFTIMYDFTDAKFYDITDWDMSYHPARQVAYFSNQSYFVSLKDGNIFRLSANLPFASTNPDTVNALPKIRVTNTIRFPQNRRYRIGQFSFTIENGVEPNVHFNEGLGHTMGAQSSTYTYFDNDPSLTARPTSTFVYKPKVDLAISKNGGQTFSSSVSYFMHKTGQYNNQPRWNQLGSANQLTCKLEFWGYGRVACGVGVVELF